MKMPTIRLLSAMLVFCTGLEPVWADPPPWAPAHGYRHKKEKHDHDYDRDDHGYYGVPEGRCNKEVIGTVAGATVGGVIGGTAASDRTLGAVAGVIVGAVVGNILGRAMDEADRRCTGHALEYAEDGRGVSWTDNVQNASYQVVPMNTFQSNSSYCREYVVTRTAAGGTDEEHGRACRNPDGSWRLMQ